jgi:hypothetical protein
MLVVLIDMLAVGMIVPVLPAMVGSSPDPSEQATWYGVGRRFVYALASSSPRRSWVRCPTATAAGRCCCWASAAWR